MLKTQDQQSVLLRSKLLFFVLTLFSVAPLFYVIYKAFTNSFTHDESFSYNNYVNTPVWDIITYKGPEIPNSHILNTLLMKFSQVFFGSSEFALRLPNVAAYAAYLIFSFFWLRKFNNYFLLLVGIIILHYNPFILDFFALARGYGLALCFMFISFYFFYKLLFSIKNVDVLLSLFFAALAVWSNFTLLNYYIGLLAAYNFLLICNILKRKITLPFLFRELLIKNIPVIAITVLLAVVIITPLRVIKSNLFGHFEGFYTNTLRSLAEATAQNQAYNIVTILSVFSIVVVIALLAIVIYEYVKKNKTASIHYFSVLLLLLLPAFSTILQHQILGTQFLEGRTGIFFIVLFSINLIFLLHYLFSNSILKYLGFIVALIYPCYLILNLIINYNPHSYKEWGYDANTKEMINQLIEEHKHLPDPNAHVTLGANWLLEPAINYYRITRNLHWLHKVKREDNIGKYDYYALYGEPNFFSNHTASVLKEFESGAVLAKGSKATNNIFVGLKATNGKFVIADRNNEGKLFANSDNLWDWETFEIISLKKDLVQIKSTNGKFVSADKKHTEILYANVESPSEFESYILIHLDSNYVAFKSANGKYLTVDPKTSEIAAKSNSVKIQEKFLLVDRFK